MFRLLDAHNTNGEITRTIARRPEGLASMVANALDQVFRSEVTRTRRWIYGYGDTEWVRVMTDDALAALAVEVVDGLTP